MTDESMSYLEALTKIKRLKEVLEQKPCEDAVSRQDALNCVTSNEFRYRMVEDIKALPSVTPKKKTGEWEVCEVVAFGDFKGTEKYKCSECGEKVGVFKSNFCPNCGARMVSK